MEEPTPITKSLHRLCVENGRFQVHPLFWTSKHLQVLHCHFNHVDSALPSFALPPSPPLSPSSDTDPDPYLARLVPMLIDGPFLRTKFAAFNRLMRAHGIINASTRPYFVYNKLKLHVPECEVFTLNDAYKLEVRPVVGNFHYDELVRMRKRALKPPRHPVPGSSNLPGKRLYERQLRELTPALWFEDPYLVCVMISLAQIQWKIRKGTGNAYFVRLLVTSTSDTTHAHVFQADIPPKLLRALDNPTEDMDNLVWPAIRHIQVPFEPHASFSERVAGQLLAGLKTQAPEETTLGQKRKRDETETEEIKSVKAWDGAVQVAVAPLANG
ncbi:uncharacterized protein FSUBG_10469 [Fusarium subglutinans]|uniref:Uncharacterized protein n=1 Tax=Gibberella subglutinans TaxID=42677 RepID=A0A8H5UKU4_GIBSU|nr:uncharacterized protein FSUBG_10469 [Fusarium subglutinans]KAF5591543.1 hypothetical protein FSUBG_10469 [Fusarium subglutinans]